MGNTILRWSIHREPPSLHHNNAYKSVSLPADSHNSVKRVFTILNHFRLIPSHPKNRSSFANPKSHFLSIFLRSLRQWNFVLVDNALPMKSIPVTNNLSYLYSLISHSFFIYLFFSFFFSVVLMLNLY